MNQYLANLIQVYQFQEHELIFEKIIFLPFPPTLGMSLTDDRVHCNLENCDVNSTFIDYDLNTKTFTVNMRKTFNHPISGNLIDKIICDRKDAGWKRADYTDLEKFKKFMDEMLLKLKK